jgi:hypothetical protein
MKPRSSLYENSIQILYGETKILAGQGVTHSWHVYRGPQGTSVNPCQVVDPFYNVLLSAAQVVEGSTIDAPPPTPVVSWPVFPGIVNENMECRIIGDGTTPPMLKCPEDGSIMQVDFAKDPQYDDPILDCGGGQRYHRVYYAEY